MGFVLTRNLSRGAARRRLVVYLIDRFWINREDGGNALGEDLLAVPWTKASPFDGDSGSGSG